ELRVVAAAGTSLQILGRSGHDRVGRLEGAPDCQEGGESGQAGRIGRAVQQELVEGLYLVGLVLGAALDGQGNHRTVCLAVVQSGTEKRQAARVGFSMQHV